MKRLLVLLLLSPMGLMAQSPEVIELTKTIRCGDAEYVMTHFATEYGEKPLWVGKDMSGTHITLLVNKDKRTWTMIQYDSRLACVLGAGETSSSNEVF